MARSAHTPICGPGKTISNTPIEACSGSMTNGQGPPGPTRSPPGRAWGSRGRGRALYPLPGGVSHRLFCWVGEDHQPLPSDERLSFLSSPVTTPPLPGDFSAAFSPTRRGGFRAVQGRCEQSEQRQKGGREVFHLHAREPPFLGTPPPSAVFRPTDFSMMFAERAVARKKSEQPSCQRSLSISSPDRRVVETTRRRSG